ncbi:MAG TPA: GNAT family protein [Actinomycetota bacterium]|nr:GNAT family protein [Actinomycetota bacterium]
MSPLPVDLGDGAILRRLRMDDLEEIWAAVEADRPRLSLWMTWIADTRTIDDEREWLDRVVADERSLEGCGVFLADRYVAGVGLMPEVFGISGEIGYWIRSEFEGRGFVTRAVRALIGIGFRELGLHRIVIRAGTDNVRSRAIPERLGFTEEGIARGAGRGAMGFYDLVVYSLLEHEWPRP